MSSASATAQANALWPNGNIPSGNPLDPLAATVTSAPNPQNVAQVKTSSDPAASSTTATQYAPASESNRLDQYRSYTYNFAIGSIPVDVVNNSRDLTAVDNAVDDFHVLDSAGKSGNNSGGISTTDIVASATNKSEVLALVESYNQATDNPGYFDLYMDDLIIESVIGAGSPQAGNSAATSVEFTVFEPYSINGFIEALEVSAVAAGYQDYLNANFCLRIRFQGYKDIDTLSSIPEIVPKSTRYFIFNITQVEISISENGSKYRVTAVPFNQKGFGRPNIQLGDINVTGDTVQEVLKNYFKRLNQSSENNAKEAAKGKSDAKVVWDKYEISAPALVVPGQKQDVIGSLLYSPVKTYSESWNSKMNDIVKSPAHSGINSNVQVNTAQDSADKHPGAVSLGNTKSVTSGSMVASAISFPFPSGQAIHESISALVRGSEYVRTDLLKNQLPKAKMSGSDKMVTYFTIRMEVEIGDKDDNNNSLTHIYRYVLEPYKIPYLNIPSQEQGTDDHTTILNNIKREFNYLFTGKNTNVLKFDLKFDNLYYTGLPKMFGNTPAAPTAAVTAGSINKDKSVQSKSSVAISSDNNPAPTGVSAPSAPIMATSPELNTYRTARSGLDPNDPFDKLARALHQHIIEGVDKTTGDLEILGDPYFFVTGTSAMADMQLTSVYETTTGEAPVTQGDVMIYLTFRNPVDISQGKTPSLALFSTDKAVVPWSGIYRVLQVKNMFKDGIFTQSLSLIRSPGQILTPSNANPAADISSTISHVPGAQVTKDSADASVLRTGIKENMIDLSVISRGYPNIGLPGVASNFSSSLATDATNLTQYAGISPTTQSQLGVTSISGATAIFNTPISSAASSLNISPASLNPAPIDTNAAALAAAGNIMNQTGNIQNAASGLASNITAQVMTASPSLSQNVASNANTSPTAVGNAGSALTTLQNSNSSDPTGISSKLGINTSALSGLGAQLASKVTSELSAISSLVPANTNLAGLDKAGVLFKGMTSAQLGNLPPLQPATSAPSPIFDPARIAIVDANGNVIPLLNGMTDLADLTSINNVTNPIGQATSGLSTQFSSAAQSILDKVGTVNVTVNQVSALSMGLPASASNPSQISTQPVMPAMIGLGSVESNQTTVNSIVQSSSNLNAVQTGVTLASKLGSNQSASPLYTLVQNSNNQGTLT